MKTIYEYSGVEFWKNYMKTYFGEELIVKWERFVTEDTIQSSGKPLHLEIYEAEANGSPIIVFSHGIAGYARVLLPFLIPLRELGYTIIAPDLQGYGYNVNARGKFTWKEHVQNLVDTVHYAKARFQRPVILGGGSMGGPLAYAAACMGADVVGVICWCLWTINDSDFIRNHTKTKRATFALLPLLKVVRRLLGNFRIKMPWVFSYKTLSDRGAKLDEMVLQDPQAGRSISLQGVISLIEESAPPIEYANFTKPIAVFQPGADDMLPAHFSRKAFNSIGTPRKVYYELEHASHFPIKGGIYQDFADKVHHLIQSGFFKENGGEITN